MSQDTETHPTQLRRFAQRVQELPFEMRLAAWTGAEVAFSEAGVPIRPSIYKGKDGLVDRLREAARRLDAIDLDIGQRVPNIELKVHSMPKEQFEQIAERFSIKPSVSGEHSWIVLKIDAGIELTVFRE